MTTPRIFRFASRNALSRGVAVGLICGAAAASGCSASSAAGNPGETASEVAARGGPQVALAHALERLSVRPAQRAEVDALQRELSAASAPAREATRLVMLAVADGVAAGRIDRRVVDPAIEAVATAAGSAKAGTQQVLGRLHATLDAAQRKLLVDAMREELAARHGGGDVAEEHAERHPGGGWKGGGGHLRVIADAIGLSADQRDAIRDRLVAERPEGSPDRRAHRGEMRARLEEAAAAFVSETFDPRALEAASPPADRARRMPERMVHLAEVALPLLTAEQRQKLAGYLRDRAAR